MKYNPVKLLISIIVVCAIAVNTAIAEPQSVNSEVNDVLLGQKPIATEETKDILIQNTQTDSVQPQPAKNVTTKAKTKPPKSIANIFFKFILALIWVGISSVAIFAILMSYKKLILKDKRVLPTYKSTEHSLQTPRNFKEALKIFLDKTKWD